MKTRIISACIMLPLLLLVVVGGYPLMAACLLIGLMGSFEFLKGFTALGIKGNYSLVVVLSIALYVIYMGQNWYGSEHYIYMVMFWFFASTIFSLLILFKKEHEKLEDAMVTMISLFYIVFFSFHVTLVEHIEEYHLFVWLIFLTAFGTDIMAYFSGYLFGKHKLCPTISPKKTIEGSIGGTLGSVILCVAFGMIFMPDYVIDCAVIGVLGGIISQFGDLTASIFKRKMGIKDYGNLIPGHGGIMDRFDSVLFTAPLVYYYVALVLV